MLIGDEFAGRGLQKTDTDYARRTVAAITHLAFKPMRGTAVAVVRLTCHLTRTTSLTRRVLVLVLEFLQTPYVVR